MKNSFYATLDRVEGPIAVLLIGEDGDTINISKGFLPENAKEGDIISFKLQVKDKKTKDEKSKIEGLLSKLAKKNRS